MQTRDADLSFKVLDVFYPGFERCGWDPEYPGFLAESPFGPLDIVPDNLPAEKYQRYAVLTALGYHRWTPALRDALVQYVKRGGILLCGDTLFLDEQEKPVAAELAEPLIGCTCDMAEKNLVRLKQPSASMDAIEGFVSATKREEWQHHWLHPVQLTTGRVVARMHETPYLIENRIGAGRVFFFAALNLVGSDAQRRGPEPFLYSSTLAHFLHSLEKHVGDGIEFSPWTSLEHIFNHKADGTAQLLVMNHGDMAYYRDVTVNRPKGFAKVRAVAKGTWEGWSRGDAMPCERSGQSLKWSFELPPKSFVLFELSR